MLSIKLLNSGMLNKGLESFDLDGIDLIQSESYPPLNRLI